MNHSTDVSPARAKGTFELGSSWQSEDESNEEKPDLPRSFTGSLVEPGFRSKFVEQRQLSIGSSLPTSEAIRKVRSSVRFADEDDSIPADKGKRVERPGLDEGDDREKRGRSNSQVLTDSDGSEGAPELQRVHSQLSMLIKDKRKQSGSQDLGPCSQPESERAAEARRKREELLKQGRQAAAPIIPTSRPGRPSYDDEGGRDRSPSPNATF
ncbi:uncharacterized protein HMPREF1541_04474 [Cyphellophora europaea CBS 101466]|uniref:Uncharacterized protein n=1 Tax=Cyphellophora europaea (strain CBS 101466) TaxID=1220924 RepID=W2RWN7_CYPE1|nr:uncharacterized protein HMPREF1541_04474 [Cyphellophora europaea CBS 101466]ETN40198.1 hypothetical protein HMPREF1541_04474 [Cyphellophora europaea CBS 101466]